MAVDYHQKDLQKHITSRDLWRQLRNRGGHETPSPDCRSLKDWETKSRSFRQHIWITDCKSLEEHLKSDTMGKVDDKRLSIDIQTLRQLIWEDANEEEQDELRDDMPDVIRWIDTSKMLVDALTKDMNSSELRRTLKTGV